METYEAVYHTVQKPYYIYNRRICTDSVAGVERMLQEEHGLGNIIVHYIELEKPQSYSEKTCGYCGHTRLEAIREGRRVHPANLECNMHLRRRI